MITFLSIHQPLLSTWIVGMHEVSFNSGESFKTDNFVFHPQFKNGSLYDDYDMSIVTVDRPMTFSANVKTICLPSISDDFAGMKVTVAGWGRLSENGDSANSLMETKVKLKTQNECDEMTRNLITFNPDSMICAYEFKTDACQVRQSMQSIGHYVI